MPYCVHKCYVYNDAKCCYIHIHIYIYNIDIVLQMKSGDIEEHYIATVLREILKGLDYLHSERKLHRDVKGKKWNRPIGQLHHGSLILIVQCNLHTIVHG